MGRLWLRYLPIKTADSAHFESAKSLGFGILSFGLFGLWVLSSAFANDQTDTKTPEALYPSPTTHPTLPDLIWDRGSPHHADRMLSWVLQ